MKRILFMTLALLPLSLSCSLVTNAFPGLAPSPTPTQTPTSTPSPLPSATPTNTFTPTPTLRPLPGSVDEARQYYDLEVSEGEWASAVIEAYGEPASDEMLPNFNPRVMRVLSYPELGLEFSFNRNQLWGIDVTRPFDGEVFGLRLGDPIRRAIDIFGSGYETFETGHANMGSVLAYYWQADLPKWFFYTQDDMTVAIGFFDKSIYGEWNFTTP